MSVSRVSNATAATAVAGLHMVTPTSVAVGSGTGSVSGQGAVTFSGANSVSLNGCFSANYNNYRIIFNPTALVGTDSALSFRYRNGGSDISASNYTGQRIVYFGTTIVASVNVTGNTLQSLSFFDSTTADRYFLNLEVYGPFLSRKKLHRVDISTIANNGTAYGETHVGWNDTATPVDGFSIFTTGTSISGTIRVYGYNNGA
jgi:hypothetical protein